MIGVDLVKNRETKEPNSELACQMHEVSKDLGLVIGKGGLHRNILRIKPPLYITKADVDFIIQLNILFFWDINSFYFFDRYIDTPNNLISCSVE
ncbi:hypothetical protein ACP6PL_02590 [Dapis sp. BLCC M126]|uniref:hypothetical protein n=1 Tax=Dapis sp. BLCC M126 TaxID=3400189 RepID=UPI003CF854DE